MRPIPLVLSLALLSACASARPPATTPPPQRMAQVTQTKPLEPRVSPVQAHASARAVSPPRLDPLEEQRRAEEQREQKEDAALREAERLFQQFIERAGDDPYYAEAVQRSRERIADIEEILRFRAQGRLERARAEQSE
jgi:hypothetical protein